MLKKSKSISIILILISTCLIPGIKPLIAENNNEILTQPIADANGPYIGIVNQTINFDGSNSYDPDGYIISYNWFFGDYSNKTGKIVNHKYTKPGVYLLTLLIKDNKNNYGCDETTVTIYEDSPPEIEIIHPIEKSIYFNNFYLLPYEKNTILIGKINITINATDDVGITKVEFYLNNNIQYTDYNEPYNWEIPRNHLNHYIDVIAYDTTGKQTNTKLEFFQWKLHPMLIIFTCLIILRIKQNGFDWISDENEFNSILIKLLTNLLNSDSDDNNELLEFINNLKNKNNDFKTKLIINFLNNHPHLKNKFKKTYPFIYFILFYIKNEDSILRNKILNSFYKDKNIFRIIFSLPPLLESFKDTNILSNAESFDNNFIEFIKNNPFISASMVLLLLLLFRNIFNDDSINDENLDNPNNENNAPIAIAKGPKLGYTNKTIKFSAEDSYDSDGTISTYKWDFGDGIEDSGVNVNHVYTYTGLYNVTLLIIDNEGKTNYDFININIIDNENTSKNIIEKENFDYILISGTLATILLLGLIGLKFRRKLFE